MTRYAIGVVARECEVAPHLRDGSSNGSKEAQEWRQAREKTEVEKVKERHTQEAQHCLHSP